MVVYQATPKGSQGAGEVDLIYTGKGWIVILPFAD
jgi:hypothetical protein